MDNNGNPTRKDNAVPSTTIALTITLDQVTGQVNVTGPVSNLILCYGMLEAAKDSCRRFIEQQSQSGIIGASTIPSMRM